METCVNLFMRGISTLRLQEIQLIQLIRLQQDKPCFLSELKSWFYTN